MNPAPPVTRKRFGIRTLYSHTSSAQVRVPKYAAACRLPQKMLVRRRPTVSTANPDAASGVASSQPSRSSYGIEE
jgi:hypothetical protein